MRILCSVILSFVAAGVGLAQTTPTLPKDHDGMLRLKASAPNKPAERPRKETAPATPAVVAPKHDGTLGLAGPEPQAKEMKIAPASLVPFPAREGQPMLAGFDPVAWVARKQALAGSATITADYDGRTVRFASMESRQAFLKEPGRYLPEYGGYCAFSLAQGEAREGQPTAFRILAGRIYLFATEAFAVSWERDAAHLVPLADDAWRTAQATR
ncbi:MAG: hypothetical protein NTZ56_13925 [Acidobacteria bacterium]|nr:hypothetical protein [Acidobacteriota bacterium]